jgi:hypothetical protein
VQKRLQCSLAGQWRFGFDAAREGINNTGGFYNGVFPDSVTLPGTTFTNCRGVPNMINDVFRVARQHQYFGRAWYQRDIEIPDEWAGKRIEMFIESAPRSIIWVDDTNVGSSENLYSPQIYDLTDIAYPGTHRLTLCLDNSWSRPEQYGMEGRHFDQNGVMGEFYLLVTNKFWIKGMKILPQVKLRRALFTVTIGNQSGCNVQGELRINVQVPGRHKIRPVHVPFLVEYNHEEKLLTFQVDLGQNALLWDEFEPNMYEVDVEMNASTGYRVYYDNTHTRFGMREFSIRGTQFAVNDKVMMLRGDGWLYERLAGRLGFSVHDIEYWRLIARTSREWGFNHLRFHTHCPPKAAFDAADEYGIYIQAELTLGRPTRIPREGEKEFDPLLEPTIKEYGAKLVEYHYNHPSFMLLTMGNEIDADEALLARLVSHMRTTDPSRFYSSGSNNYLRDTHMVPGDDFWCTQKTSEVWDVWKARVRGSGGHVDPPLGSVQVHSPNSLRDYSKGIETVDIPVVGFEVGQYETTPNFDEIDRFGSNEVPFNLLTYREIMKQQGILNMEKKFYWASGQLCGLCYREDIEMYLRTSNIGGFHLLSFADNCSSGTALSGMLSVFYESKGIMTPVQWRRFCNDRVILLRTDRFVYASGDILKGQIQLANYGKGGFSGASAMWRLRRGNETLLQDILQPHDVPQGELLTLGEISVPLAAESPCELSLYISLEGGIENEYSIWVYPDKELPSVPDVVETIDWETTSVALAKGKKVLYFPADLPLDKAHPGEFASNFWSYSMFAKSSKKHGTAVPAGTMGVFCDPNHPALACFPNRGCSDWQWFPIVTNGGVVILNDFPTELQPIIWGIDNPMRGDKLGLVFELQVGQGRLLVCMSRLPDTDDQLPARWLHHSLIKYMSSDSFSPAVKLDATFLDSFFGKGD